MSDDIVKRLRDYEGDAGHYALMRDAADEIDRLRAHASAQAQDIVTLGQLAGGAAKLEARTAALEGALRDVLDRFTTAFPACEDYPPIQAARAALVGEK